MTRFTVDRRPIVFISYSWTTAELQKWVMDLATELRTTWGIDVILDVWEMKAGNDMIHFMEESVRNADKVLVICDQGYQTKADHRRSSGVSTEAQIISLEVYANAKQEKFIPVFYEKNETEEPFLPVFLKTRLGFDLSTVQKYMDNIRKLVENIYEVPQKPDLGPLPKFISISSSDDAVRQGNSRVEFDREQEERIVWLLPRGFLFFYDITFRDDPSWSVKAYFVKYNGEAKLGVHYKPEYREHWNNYDNRFKVLQIPQADWHMDEYYLAVRFAQELRERAGQEDLKDLVQEKLEFDHHVFYFGPEETVYLPDVPDKFKFLFETGELRDIQYELNSLREGKLYDPEDLVSAVYALRHDLLLSAQEYFGENNLSFKLISDVVENFDPKSDNYQMNAWLDKAAAVLGAALDRASKNVRH